MRKKQKTEKVTQEKDNEEKTHFVNTDAVDAALFSKAFRKGPSAEPAMLLPVDGVVRINTDVFSDPETGKVVAVFKKGDFDSGAFRDVLTLSEEWFEFTIPTFEQMSSYRQRSSNNPQRTPDRNFIRNLLIIYHLSAWSIKDNKVPVPVEKEVDDSLSKDTVRYVNRIPVVVWDVVLTSLEREILI